MARQSNLLYVESSTRPKGIYSKRPSTYGRKAAGYNARKPGSVPARKSPQPLYGQRPIAYDPREVALAYLRREDYYVSVNGGMQKLGKLATTIDEQIPAYKKQKPFAYKPTPGRRKRLALLLPGHNEELIIATTIRSAVAAGQKLEDIYVVDDFSSDQTRSEALKELPENNVLSVDRSGKALAVQKAIKHFKIKERYEWVHVADADSVFCPDYFNIYRKKLAKGTYAVAVGFVQSLRGNWISTYRSLTYTYSQQVQRRIQSKLGMVSVFPGPITSFNTDILDKLEFDTNTLTEDFDITLQVHRKNLGKIAYIPKAINYTQDPQTLRDFCKQTARWQRGFFQGVLKYHIGINPHKIDVSIGFQLFQMFLYLLQFWVLLPIFIVMTHSFMPLLLVTTADFIVMGLTTLFSMAASKRWYLLGALPYFYLHRGRAGVL
jgi:cellulose synthase/poly-beta-1,6-N-acetylglucosamine synthase-like glycosyltransferase